jgi:hypothetical protein
MRSRTFDREVEAAGIRLADAAHTVWAAAELECAAALVAWSEAGPGGRDRAHLAYRAALDREEAAARDFERLSTWAAEAV